MAGIRAKNTEPEMIVRRGLHAMGLRYRLHVRNLPGKPDLVFPKYRAVVFVNGCFWHGHECADFKWPKTREDFWREKIGHNKVNDSKNSVDLLARDWRTLVIWECAIKRQKEAALLDLFDRCQDWLKSRCNSLVIEAR